MTAWWANSRITGRDRRPFGASQGEPAAIADAVRDHYKPVGQGMTCRPRVTVAVSLADKLDTIVGFFDVGEHLLVLKIRMRSGALRWGSSLLERLRARLPLKRVIIFITAGRLRQGWSDLLEVLSLQSH